LNTDAVTPKVDIVKKEIDKEFKCTMCGDSWDTQKNFNKSKSIMYAANNGYVNICKGCRDKLYYYYVDLYSGNEEKAIDRMCQIFDWFCHEEPLSASKQISSDRSRVNDYVNKLNLTQTSRKGSTYVDTIKHNIGNQDDNIIDDIIDVKDFKNIKQKTVRFFGTGFSDEDYMYLQDQYDDWITRHECKTKVQEEIFKRLCSKQLEILKATRAGTNTKDLDRTYQDLLSTANLQPKQTNMDALAENRTFGQLIKIWEDEKPIPEPSEEFKDVDGIGKYISVFFLGHLAKMVGIKNRFARMYEEEIKKYTVEKPEYEEDSEALFDAIFGNHVENGDKNG